MRNREQIKWFGHTEFSKVGKIIALLKDRFENARNGTMKPKPDVLKLGSKQKAIRKMIFFYHPDKIDKSNLKYKILCEEITKILTEHTEKTS